MANATLQQAVREELQWEPKIDHTTIAVTADDNGEVTLRGTVGSLRQKIEARRAAERVRGVRNIKDELDVRLLVGDRREDAELRGAVLQALMLDSVVPSAIDATARDGMIILTGRARWHYEREEAEFVAANVRGVRSVRSEIILDPTPSAVGVKTAIEQAIQRSARDTARGLKVQTEDGIVTLAGTVPSWVERDAAVRAAWSVPGVSRVNDRISVQS